ncbi:DUF397 domain-containing protein [Amycolatopsis palatopharyngis]|uniref:DUF397 domain-containing protein n=1 Tax=Amycolatopsis palatopharyngis TaxID=187982 RepID=UPI001FE51385|nr:DUF397 domain-containing protein [Amycolatopsis palatopharyngis]
MGNIGHNSRGWRRSSHSGGGNDCVEVAFHSGGVALRDSKHPFSGMLVTSRPGWSAMLAAVRAGGQRG